MQELACILKVGLCLGCFASLYFERVIMYFLVLSLKQLSFMFPCLARPDLHYFMYCYLFFFELFFKFICFSMTCLLLLLPYVA